jgi:hypothetical protein
MRIEKKLLEGREHYIVPMVMAVEGVLRGSNGPIFYPVDELRKSVPLWNGKPVVVYHPDMAKTTSGYANHPEIFNQQKVGTIFNTRIVGKKLKADAWIDIERVRRVDERVQKTIESKIMMEVSTGLSFPIKEEIGIHNGSEYFAIARNLQPDHLAILPDRRGACSILDGAGLCRNNRIDDEVLTMPNWSFS